MRTGAFLNSDSRYKRDRKALAVFSRKNIIEFMEQMIKRKADGSIFALH